MYNTSEGAEGGAEETSSNPQEEVTDVDFEEVVDDKDKN